MHRIRQLDGVRGIAILAVFIHHALHAKLLWMGVDLFFVLSGFLITGVLSDARRQTMGSFFGHFYARRARRILAPYALLLLVVTIVFGASWMHQWYLYLLLTNFLEPLHIPHPGALTPLWSLAVEEQFYLVWPFAVYLLSPRHLRWLCVSLMVLAPVLRGALHFQQHWPIYMLTPFRMDLLAAGGLLYLTWKSDRQRIERWGTAAGATMAVAGLAGLLTLGHFGLTTYGNSRTGNVLIYECCLLISVGVVLYALAGRGVGWMRWAPLTYIGTISYSMYLIHTGIIQLVQIRLHGMASAVVALALTIGYGTVSWFAMEKPLLGRRKGLREKSTYEPAST